MKQLARLGIATGSSNEMSCSVREHGLHRPYGRAQASFWKIDGTGNMHGVEGCSSPDSLMRPKYADCAVSVDDKVAAANPIFAA